MKDRLNWRQLLVVMALMTTLTACAVKGPLPVAESQLQQKKVSGQILTATEAYDLLKKKGNETLFVDVRTKGEITKYGTPTLANAHIPYKLKQWNEQQNKFQMVDNPKFLPNIDTQMKKQGLNGQNSIILICSQGKRSAKAAKALATKGYENVYTVLGGVVKGWQSSHLPLSGKTCTQC